MPQEINDKTLYTYEEVAKKTGYNEDSIRNMANSVDGYRDLSSYKVKITNSAVFLKEDVFQEFD